MFFNLIHRNSIQSRKENRLFFSSLLISIIAFYIILSLSKQDIMIFLQQMESDAINRIFQMIPLFYGVTLFLLFFLVYFASKYQLERRSHEFGIYLMMGMKRFKLFFMLFLEDLYNSLLSLGIGIPAAVLLSELISLITARFVGIGILGHQFTFSLTAVLWTVLGFLWIKLLAFLILSGRLFHTEISYLLTPVPKQTKRRLSKTASICLFFLGIFFLGIAYFLAISKIAWGSVFFMGITFIFGLAGTFSLFYGLQVFLEFLARQNRKKKRLFLFTFRQLQEYVIFQPNVLSISSLLILSALCFFGFGISVSKSYTNLEEHNLDYTFSCYNPSIDIKEKLQTSGLSSYFSALFEMKTGIIYGEEDTIQLNQAISLLEQEPDSKEKTQLLQQLSYINDHCYAISLSGYNELLTLSGKEPIKLESRQAAVYMDQSFISIKKSEMIEHMLSQTPQIQINGEPYFLTGTLQTTNLVTDRSITLSFALIVTDETFKQLTADNYSSYWNAVLTPELRKQKGLMQAIPQVNQELSPFADSFEIEYESYLKNMGRQLFYVAAASYLTLYLAVLFFVIGNTILGVQFLMQQQKTGQRYRILIQLGSSFPALCQSCAQQIRWYFEIPAFIAAISSFFGVSALYTGLLPSSLQGNIFDFFWIAVAMIILLCVVEYLYLLAVTKAGCRYILTLMKPKREE